MLVHPDRDRDLLTLCAGRLLLESFGVVGARIRDTQNFSRIWQVTHLFAPIPHRSLSGIRARLKDDKGFISFLNQRDLEVSIGLVQPGDYCAWLHQDYVATNHRDWYGPCLDGEDLMDDLFLRETELRATQEEMTGSVYLPTGYELERRIHIATESDFEELLYLRGDIDFETGSYPDVRMKTIEQRWVRVERRPLEWKHV